MDRDMLFRHLEQRYTSKRDMISRVPLGVQPDALWQELLNQRRSKSTVLPLYSYKGTPYWYVTTDKMIAASEKIVEALYENDADYDPYAEPPTVSTLEEIFFTSYVEGSQMTIQAAMDFLTGGQPPRDIEEQLITNNRVAGSYASANLYRPIEAGLLRELITILTDGMDEGGQDYRTTETVDYSPADGEQFSFPSARTVPDRVGELSAFLASPQIHPLIKAAVAQAYMIMRFRGQISQGLLLPLSQFPEIPADAAVGDDVTELLGVRKWEIEERATTGGTVIGNLPYDIPHTDETRVQEEPELIQAFAGLEYYISTKMDGSSHSLGIDENGFHVTGHNYEYTDDGSSSFYELIKARGYQEKMEEYAQELGLKTLTIQGELCAPGIQQNRLRLTKPEWYVFTIRENGKRVGLKRMLLICEALDMTPVPIEEVGMDLPSKYPTVEALLARADGDYPNGGKKEGIVVRPTTPVFCPLISASLSMKIVSNKYLLKNEG